MSRNTVLSKRVAQGGGLAILLGWTAAATLAQFTMTPAPTIAMPSAPDGVVSADFNADGFEDLAVSREGPDRVSVMLSAGDGTFAAPVNYPTGSGTAPGALIAADLDDDGDLDLAVALKGTNSVRVLTNTGAGAFVLGATAGVGNEPVSLVAAQLDADIFSDLVAVNRSDDSISVLINSGAATFTSTTVAVGQDPRGVTSADFSGDGLIDLAVTNHNSRSVTVLINLGAGTSYSSATLSVGSELRPAGIAAGDLDGNGAADLAVATSGNAFNFVSVFLNTGTGTFSGPVNYATGGVNPDHILAVSLGCDTSVDLAVTNQDSNTLSLLRNTGTGAFGAAQVLSIGTRPGTIAAGDFDNDGNADLAVTNRDSNDVSVFLNDTCSAVLVGDVNCDGGVNFGDINPFVMLLTDPAAWLAAFPGCPMANGDINGNGTAGFDDINPFVALLSGGGA